MAEQNIDLALGGMASTKPQRNFLSNPLHPLTNVLFVLSATALFYAVDWLISSGALPGIVLGRSTRLAQQDRINFELVATLMWFGMLFFGTFVLPIGAAVVWGRYRSVRQVLLPWIGVLAIQILSEYLFTATLFVGISFFIGTCYSSFRVWQLWYARRYFATTSRPAGVVRNLVDGLLAMGALLWGANLFFLFFARLPLLLGLR